MIVDMILADHQAGHEIFAVIGNSVQMGDLERADELARFRGMWMAHSAMMDEVVYPVLLEASGQAEALEPVRANQRRIGDLATRLARLEAHRTHYLAQNQTEAPEPWLVDFQHLKEAFDHQVGLETGRVCSLIMNGLPGDRIADMSRRARELRERSRT